MSEDYNSNEIIEIQKIIDESDPFLLEALQGKTEEELLDEIEKLYKEFYRIPESNPGHRHRHMKIIKTVEALYRSKCINKGIPKGGIIIG